MPLKERIDQLEEENENIKSRNSNLEIESKLLNMKLMCYDEKCKQEKTLYEAQIKLRMINIENEYQSRIYKCKSNYQMQMSEFLGFICRTFNEMYHVNDVIEIKSVESLLLHVKERLNALDKLVVSNTQSQQELILIRQILDAKSNSRVSNVVSEIVQNNKKQAKEIEQLTTENLDLKRRQKIEDSFNWDEWSKQIYSLITDGFVVFKTANEIRSVIEEAVISSYSNYRITKKIDFLRQEKKLLISGAQNIRNDSKSIRLKSVLSVVCFVRRVQKMSGYLKSDFSFRHCKDGEMPSKKDRAASKAPIRLRVNNCEPLLKAFVVEKLHRDENQFMNS